MHTYQLGLSIVEGRPGQTRRRLPRSPSTRYRSHQRQTQSESARTPRRNTRRTSHGSLNTFKHRYGPQLPRSLSMKYLYR